MTVDRVQLMRWLTGVSLLALLSLQMLASVLQEPSPPWIVWVMRVAPLLIFVPGMWADKLRSYIWLCFVCLLYFMVLVLRLFAEPTNMVSVLAMSSVVTLFVSATLYVRWRARQMRVQAEPAAS